MAFERFRDRRDAGRRLAEELGGYAGQAGVVVLALPRGGTPVAHEVARALEAPLDVFMVRKLGIPWNEEYAMGAIASGGEQWLDARVVHELGISRSDIENVVAREQRELARRERTYRRGRPPPALHGRTVILVDDGLATGSTMLAAVRAVRRQQPARTVVAVPVASAEACELLRREADEVVCAQVPESFLGVGRWYVDFSQTTDEEVCALLDDAAHHRHGALSP